jgi:hypothetical protein
MIPVFVGMKMKKIEGVGFTKGKLIELAEGEICGYLDPDDAILPNAVSASIEVFQKKRTQYSPILAWRNVM